jgi:hypothetical protein
MRMKTPFAVAAALSFLLPFTAAAQESALALVCSGNGAFLQRTSSAPASAFVIDDPRLVSGPVDKAVCSEVPVATPAKVMFNGREATLDYRCEEADDEGLMQCTLELDHQPLARRVAFENEQLAVRISFAGDLDRDGRLDLLVDVARSRFVYRPALFLSSPAPRGVPLTSVAELSHSSRSNP